MLNLLIEKYYHDLFLFCDNVVKRRLLMIRMSKSVYKWKWDSRFPVEKENKKMWGFLRPRIRA